MATQTVPMNNGAVPQHKRLAAGAPVTGKTTPPAKLRGPKAPA